MRLAVLAILGFVACATTANTANERRADVRCNTIELYQSGLAPSRPYRVLGPVSADDENALRDQACHIGAQAIIELRREAPAVSTSAGSGEPRSSMSGSAVVFTDGPDGGAPPP